MEGRRSYGSTEVGEIGEDSRIQSETFPPFATIWLGTGNDSVVLKNALLTLLKVSTPGFLKSEIGVENQRL